jgi:hypothetical protein
MLGHTCLSGMTAKKITTFAAGFGNFGHFSWPSDSYSREYLRTVQKRWSYLHESDKQGELHK